MVRSVSPVDLDLTLKFLRVLAKYNGISKNQIIDDLNLKDKSTISKIDYIITNCNKNHWNLIKLKSGLYHLKHYNLPKVGIPLEKLSEIEKREFWYEIFNNFSLYQEVVQNFSFGNSLYNVSKITGVSEVSTQEIVRWAKYVGGLEVVKNQKNYFKITTKSIEELLNRIAVCQLGILGCDIIKREKEMETGERADVWGQNSKNNKEYYIEAESSAEKLIDGMRQLHHWVNMTKNLEKWVIIPKSTLKTITFKTIIKRYNNAKRKKILIKLCDLREIKIQRLQNLKIPSGKDMILLQKILNEIIFKKRLSLDNIYQIINEKKNKVESFINRIIRFGLFAMENNELVPNFKI